MTKCNSAKLRIDGKEGPLKNGSYRCTTTMASSVARRLIAAKILDEDEELSIPMRARERIKLAPEHKGCCGRATGKRVAPKLEPVYGPSTVVQKFAKLLQSTHCPPCP